MSQIKRIETLYFNPFNNYLLLIVAWKGVKLIGHYLSLAN